MARKHQLTRSHFLNVQLPLVDLRLLIGQDTGRLSKPSWPDPDIGREFVRGIGLVRPLLDPKEPRAWRGPQPYIDATPLIRLSPAWGDRSSIWIKPIHRRLVSDGLTWRVDLGFVIKWRKGVGPRTATALVQRILSLPVRISGREYPLHDFDRKLATDLLSKTTRTGYHPAPWWMTSGRLLMFIDEIDTRRNRVNLQAFSTVLSARPVSTFVLRRREFHVEDARFIRTELIRTYHQLETLRLVLRAWRTHPEILDIKLMRDFLAAQLERVSHRSKKGYLQPDVMGIAVTVANFPIDDLAILADDLRKESKGLMRQLNDVAEILDKSRHRQVNGVPINFMINFGRFEVSSGDSFTFHDQAAGLFGQNSRAEGSTFVAGTNSPASVDLSDLIAAVSSLKEHLDTEAAADLEIVSAEIVESDNPQKIKSALQKIAGIAATAGSAGTAVIEAVKSVAGALTNGS